MKKVKMAYKPDIYEKSRIEMWDDKKSLHNVSVVQQHVLRRCGLAKDILALRPKSFSAWTVII